MISFLPVSRSVFHPRRGAPRIELITKLQLNNESKKLILPKNKAQNVNLCFQKDLLMYRMDGDRIIENESPYRIKMQFNSEERWTKAMKLLLLNLKRAIGLVPAMTGKSGD